MLAVEFETHVENGIIKIPEKYRQMAEGDLKIIILKKEEKPDVTTKQKVTNIKRLLKQIKSKNIFQDIENPGKWQKAIRDEWK
jgi:hypothetical protein